MAIFLIALWLTTLTLFVGLRAKATKSRPIRVIAPRRLPADRHGPHAAPDRGRLTARALHF
jgi:hypothetical protein